MTSKQQKARDLYDKFFDTVHHASNDDVEHDAKQCALILVDELIKENEEIESIVGQGFNFDYWQQVKEEIEKL